DLGIGQRQDRRLALAQRGATGGETDELLVSLQGAGLEPRVLLQARLVEAGLEVSRLLLEQTIVGLESASGVARRLVRLGQRQKSARIGGVHRLRPQELAHRVLVPSREQVQSSDRSEERRGG